MENFEFYIEVIPCILTIVWMLVAYNFSLKAKLSGILSLLFFTLMIGMSFIEFFDKVNLSTWGFCAIALLGHKVIRKNKANKRTKSK